MTRLDQREVSRRYKIKLENISRRDKDQRRPGKNSKGEER